MLDTYKTRAKLHVNDKTYTYCSLNELPKDSGLKHLPISLKILLENLLRREDGLHVTEHHIKALLSHASAQKTEAEIPFMPARVLLQDFTGVPAIVDLAAMRDAMKQLGGDVENINPLQPVELVIDHSVQVDKFGSTDAFEVNGALEFSRNKERYAFLRWGQTALSNFKVVPPDTGIVHQVNLEYLGRVVFAQENAGELWAYPDTVVGTDSHTPMINGLGVLGWGVGGIEAEAAMLGQAVSMLIPEVIGFKLTGRLPEGTTATDLVLTVTQMLRQKGVVGKFVEFYGDGLDELPVADRATIANMSPENGSTVGFFPIDKATIDYLHLTGRPSDQIALIEAYSRAQGMFRDADTPEPLFSDTLFLDLGDIETSIAGPKRPQDRITLRQAKATFLKDIQHFVKDVQLSEATQLQHGAIVIAAITSCTNTSNPAVMLAAGLLAKKAYEKGLTVPAWVKTSLAPGSRVVTDYLQQADLTRYLDALGFQLVGYGCTTCIGNSGPLPPEVARMVDDEKLSVCAILSGNRNFEGRIHPQVQMNYLASPPLVVAYALAGRMDIDLFNEPLGFDKNNRSVYLRDLWPTQEEINASVAKNVRSKMFTDSYSEVYRGDKHWNELDVPVGELYAWSPDSTYVKNPPYFVDMPIKAPGIHPICGARCLAKLGNSVTTDHISPAGDIAVDSPAGHYLQSQGVKPVDFNSYGSRRGNHEVMMRGTFANVRLRNELAPGTEGPWTRHFPSDEIMSIYDASMRYQKEIVPLIILAGSEYGSGSSRDWAAKGPCLLGVKAVIAVSFERIHRSNLIGMGILPLEFLPGMDATSIGLTGRETFDIQGLVKGDEPEITVVAHSEQHGSRNFNVKVRLDTPQEINYYKHGGILHYVLRQLKKEEK
jgi:aconitate hydratase